MLTGMDDEKETTKPEHLQFHIAEYSRLTNEINQRLGESARYEATTAIALGAYIGWFLTNLSELPLTGLAVWAIAIAPLLFVLAAVVRSAYSYIKVGQTADYLKKIEAEFADPNLFGWEHVRSDAKLLEERRGRPYGTPFKMNLPFLVSQTLIWLSILLLAATPLATKIF